MCKVYAIAVIATLGFVFQGCGLKAPLRLPDRAKPAESSAATPAPAIATAAPATAKEP